jgi:hypothetical protein
LDGLDEKPNHTKNSKSSNFEGKSSKAKKKTHFLNHLIRKLCSMGSKCLALDASHMCRK